MRTWKRVSLWTAVVVACIIGGWAWKNARSAPASFDIAVWCFGMEASLEWSPVGLGLPFRLPYRDTTPCDELWGLDTRTGEWGLVWRREMDQTNVMEPIYCPASRELLWWNSEHSVLLAMPLSGGTPREVLAVPVVADPWLSLRSVHPSAPRVLFTLRSFTGPVDSTLLEMNVITGEAKEVFPSNNWYVAGATYSPSGDGALVRVLSDGKEEWYYCSLDGKSEPLLLIDLAKPDLDARVAWAPGPEPVVVYQVYSGPQDWQALSTLAGESGMKLWSLALGTGKATLAVNSAQPARLLSIGPTGTAVARIRDGLILWPWGDWEARKTVLFRSEVLLIWCRGWDGDRLLLKLSTSPTRDRECLVTVDGKTGELKEWEDPCEVLTDAGWVPRP